MTGEIPPPPRTVKPRSRTYKRLPVIAIAKGHTLDENGEVRTMDALVKRLPSMPSTLFIKLSSGDFVAKLTEQYQPAYPASWQYEFRTHERSIISPNGEKVAARISVVVKFFGWKGGSYHKIIDPVVMYGDKLNDGHELDNLLKWGVRLRDFCDENGMEVRATIGSISAQFLTDRRFYPDDRRKVPHKINERVRHELPGNYYQLTVCPSPKREFRAWYIDQSRAHHYHARTTLLPDANSLYAHGYFTDLSETMTVNMPTNFYGLLYLDVQAPEKRSPGSWVKTGRQFIYTNEVQHLLDSGYQLSNVVAAWGSYERDTGLAKFAAWAESQLDRYNSPTWLKPILLATYGTLASRATNREAVFRLAKRGQPVRVVTGHKSLEGKLVQSPQKLEPGIANVLHRGMIEAATRSESIGLGQWLTGKGFRVLSVYADAVIIEDNPDLILPVLPEPWRIKRQLNYLKFINQQAFVSGEMTKLPGVAHEVRQGYRMPLARTG